MLLKPVSKGPGVPFAIDVVGCGSVTMTYHLPVIKMFQRKGFMKVRGCYDVVSEYARSAAKEVSAVEIGVSPSSFDGIHGALIATPPEAHADLVDLYVKENKHVLVEKPFATSADAARRLADTARTRGVSILVGHFRRFYPSLDTAREMMERNSFGKPLRVIASEGGRWRWFTHSTYVVESPFGGVIFDTGSHLLDMVFYILGIDVGGDSVRVNLAKIAKTPSTEPSHEVDAILNLEAPCVPPCEIRILVSRQQPIANAIKIYCEGGVLVVPTSFSSSVFVKTGTSYRRLEGADGENIPRDAIGCFIREYRDLLQTGSSGSSRLQADRFVMLTTTLEQMTLRHE